MFGFAFPRRAFSKEPCCEDCLGMVCTGLVRGLEQQKKKMRFEGRWDVSSDALSWNSGQCLV